jgi:hypothetical protein
MTNNTKTLAIGSRVIIQNRGEGWDGLTGTIVDERYFGGSVEFRVKFDYPADTPFGAEVGWWTDDSGYVVPLAAEGPKASLTHETSRTYASKARSRALPEWANEILERAADGEEIDVVTFRKAVTQALSLAATRAGQSMGRRVWTREARHLIYWADAIIDNHIAGLPVYEGGPRSPKIHALQEEIIDLKQAASDERRRLCAEIDTEKARSLALIKEKSDLEIQVEDLLQGRRNDYDAMQHLYSECNEFHAALDYAFGLLSNADQARLAGFRDGYGTRVNDEA